MVYLRSSLGNVNFKEDGTPFIKYYALNTLQNFLIYRDALGGLKKKKINLRKMNHIVPVVINVCQREALLQNGVPSHPKQHLFPA